MTKGNSHLINLPFFQNISKVGGIEREGIGTVIHDDIQDMLATVALLKKDFVYILNVPLLCLRFPLVASFLCMTFPLKIYTIDRFSRSNTRVPLVLSANLRLLGRLNISPDIHPLDTFP